MDTHIQGPVSGNPPNLGAVISQRAFPIHIADENIAKNLCVIEASSDNPILVEFDAFVETVFNAGSTNTLVIGNTTTANAYVTSGTINPASLGYHAGAKTILRARTQITATVGSTGTAATTGLMDVIIRATGLGKGVGIAT